MIIRDITPADRQIYLDMTKVFYSGDAVANPVKDENFENAFDTALHSDDLRILLLEDEGEFVGYSVLAFFYSIEFGGKIVLLEELYMKPESRGRGYGQQYFDWIFHEYKKTAGFILEVTKSNERAIKLYEKLGFEEMSYLRMRKINK